VVQSVLVSKLMAGVISGQANSLAHVCIRCYVFGGVDNPNVYSRIYDVFCAIGLDGSTYLVGDVTSTQVHQSSTSVVEPVNAPVTFTVDIDSGNFRLLGAHLGEFEAGIYVATELRSIRGTIP